MFNWIRFSTLFLSWRARHAGALDGRTLIPHRDEERPPKYLLYLRDLGHWRAAALERRWQEYDLGLYPSYVRALRLCEQARARLEEVEGHCQRAEALRRERGTDRNLEALRRWHRARERARRRLERAELALGAARARRQSRWEEMGARFRALAAEMDHYMQIYSDANIKLRDQNDSPLGLLEENRPRLELPRGLRELHWEVPPRFAEPGLDRPSLPL
ncbi:MAG: hypothetical protein ACOY93_08135 [Bacillota bacterium]